MRRIVAGLTMLTVLSACASTAGRKLSWTAENVQAVGKKCGIGNLDVKTPGLSFGGLHALGKQPPGAKKMACLERHIQLPPDFFVLFG